MDKAGVVQILEVLEQCLLPVPSIG
jgi:hypothetical protein